MKMTKREELPRRELRYRKSIVEMLNWEDIYYDLNELSEQAGMIKYAWDDENVLNAIDGDEELLWELKLAYTGLSEECDRLREHLADFWDCESDNFNSVFAAVNTKLPDKFLVDVYDSGDYFRAEDYEGKEAESVNREKLKRLTKDKLLDLIGDSLSLLLRYLDIKDRINAIASAVEIVQDENGAILQAVKDIEEQYIVAERVKFDWRDKETERFEDLLKLIPDRIWVE